MPKKDSDLFFTCSLIELIGRTQKLPRKDVVHALGETVLRRIYTHASVLHCEPIARTAEIFTEMCQIPVGTFDNVVNCNYTVPDYWTIGDVYTRLIQDVQGDADVIATLIVVYNHWISDSICNYNSDFFYQSREYIRVCYQENAILQ